MLLEKDLEKQILEILGDEEAFHVMNKEDANRILKEQATRILKEHFTQEAQDKLKDVVVRYRYSPIAQKECIRASVSLSGKSIFVVGKQLFLDTDLVHEYVHIADMKGMIPRYHFSEAYDEMYGLENENTQDDIDKIEKILRIYTAENRESELIARISELISVDSLSVPQEMLMVYSRVLKNASLVCERVW